MKDKFFFLNYLSFESLNLTQMCYSVGLGCATHGATQLNTIMSGSAHAGYPISYLYKEMHNLQPEAKFILLREDPQVILKHLLYGKYADSYTPQIIHDFNEFYGITLDNLSLEVLNEKANAYYSEVSSYFGQTLVTIDFPRYESSIFNFISSPDFITFYKALDRCFRAGQAEDAQASALRWKNSMVNLFTKKEHGSFPTKYTVDNVMGMALGGGSATSNITALKNSLLTTG